MEGGTTLTYILISIGLIILAGLMSGLTLGLLSLDSVDIEVLKRSGTEREKRYVKRIEPVIRNTHLLLVTLLLTNAAAMEALPIFLDRLVSPTVAVILSVTAVLFFGEIIPQAACKSYGLAIGAYAAPLVRALMLLEWVVAKPISMVLDWALGEDHSALFRRGQLKALVDLHSSAEGIPGGYLAEEEINIIRGALDLTGKQATVAMTPLDKVFMLALDAELNEATLRKLLALGHSRVPVHTPGNRNEILGLILVKELILVDQHAGTRVCDLKLRGIPHLRGDVAAYDLLKLFQTGRSHMVVLTQPPPRPPREAGEAPEPPGTPVRREHVAVDMDAGPSRPSTPRAEANGEPAPPPAHDESVRPPIGIVTIEDLIEELIGTEIVDETDEFVDNLRQEKVNKALLAKSLPPNLRKLLLARTSSAALAVKNPSKKLLAAAVSAGSEDEGGPALRQAISEEGDPRQPLLRNAHAPADENDG